MVYAYLAWYLEGHGIFKLFSLFFTSSLKLLLVTGQSLWRGRERKGGGGGGEGMGGGGRGRKALNN